MNNVILIDPETGEPNKKLPEYLAKCALLARNAHATNSDTYKCPKTGREMTVHSIRSKDEEVPGVRLKYEGRVWECWSRGLSRKGNEYFGVRVRDPLFFVSGKDGISGLPKLIAYGNLFVNSRGGKKTYNPKLVSPTVLAKRGLANRLVDAGLVTREDIARLDQDIPSPNRDQPRSSTVRLG